MKRKNPSFLTKFRWSAPWLACYPLWAIKEWIRGMTETSECRHLIFIVANHFEPSWNSELKPVDWITQRSLVEHWCKQARAIGCAVQDSDGMPFRHTYFFPAEQYHPSLIDKLAEEQSLGFGEVEIHLHHGVKEPDDASNLKRSLESFRDTLAEQHRCLSRLDSVGRPRYAFVHGNLSLANSNGGRCCGVDSEMQILADTGCYADFTLPAGLHPAQVPRINAIYQCGRPLNERSPHRSGPNLRVGCSPVLPVLFTGPLVIDWRGPRRLPFVPRIEDGVLAANRPPTLDRLHNWRRAGVGIHGKPEWIFIKCYCHGFFHPDQPAMIAEPMRRFLEDLMELSNRDRGFKVHFATAREAFNIAMAAVDGRTGEPGLYRNYRLHQIMHATNEFSIAKYGSEQR